MRKGMNHLKLYLKQGKVCKQKGIWFNQQHNTVKRYDINMNERYDAVTEELEWRIYEYFNLIDAD